MTVEKKFNVTGMHCPSCSMLITMNLGDVEGVQDVSCDYKTGETVVKYDPAVTNEAAIMSEIEAAGYTACAA
jgi:copper chaperone CopZ